MSKHEVPFTTPEAERDVVAAVSYRSDGTPAQSEGYRVIGQDQAPADAAPADPAQA